MGAGSFKKQSTHLPTPNTNTTTAPMRCPTPSFSAPITHTGPLLELWRKPLDLETLGPVLVLWSPSTSPSYLVFENPEGGLQEIGAAKAHKVTAAGHDGVADGEGHKL